jgi:hypothetical protein
MVLEKQKAHLAHKILTATDEKLINGILLFVESYNPVYKPNKRKIGILDGKADIKFQDDFEMTAEELLGMR